MEDEEYSPRKDDHRVEPLVAGLRAAGARPRASAGARPGCGGAALLVLALAAFAGCSHRRADAVLGSMDLRLCVPVLPSS
jgi:hypothetical protein